MKTIIAGSRELPKTKIETIGMNFDIDQIHNNMMYISEVVSGGAKGVDQLGEDWAATNGIPIKQFIPEWGRLGKKAGPLRNRQMAEYADACIVFWDGNSRGSKSMIQEALNNNLQLFVFTYKENLFI